MTVRPEKKQETMVQEQTEQTKFEGWAIVEVFGHQRYAGYVSTQVFGTAAMFRVDVPALPEREDTLKSQEWIDGHYRPTGTKVKRGAVQAYTKLFGVGAIYSMTPCTEAAAVRAVESMQQRPLMVVEDPQTTKAITDVGQTGSADNVCPTTGLSREECECPDCGEWQDGEENEC